MKALLFIIVLVPCSLAFAWWLTRMGLGSGQAGGIATAMMIMAIQFARPKLGPLPPSKPKPSLAKRAVSTVLVTIGALLVLIGGLCFLALADPKSRPLAVGGILLPIGVAMIWAAIRVRKNGLPNQQ